MKKKDAVVKIDGELLEKVEAFIQKPENRLIYANKKHLVNLAIIDFLNVRNTSKTGISNHTKNLSKDFLKSHSLRINNKSIKKVKKE
jgi:hypothetical protein